MRRGIGVRAGRERNEGDGDLGPAEHLLGHAPGPEPAVVGVVEAVGPEQEEARALVARGLLERPRHVVGLADGVPHGDLGAAGAVVELGEGVGRALDRLGVGLEGDEREEPGVVEDRDRAPLGHEGEHEVGVEGVGPRPCERQGRLGGR